MTHWNRSPRDRDYERSANPILVQCSTLTLSAQIVFKSYDLNPFFFLTVKRRNTEYRRNSTASRNQVSEKLFVFRHFVCLSGTSPAVSDKIQKEKNLTARTWILCCFFWPLLRDARQPGVEDTCIGIDPRFIAFLASGKPRTLELARSSSEKYLDLTG